MQLDVNFDIENGSFTVNDNDNIPKTIRVNKGKSLLSLLNDYTVIDIETTGLSSEWDEIIEISALKISNGEIVDKFSTLIKPNEEISDFIAELTGITNDMVKDAPLVEDVIKPFQEFIGDSVLVGHNVNFDINFLYDVFENNDLYFTNSFIDTMRFSRRIIPGLEHYRLKDISEALNVEYVGAHRAENDCCITYQCYERLKALALSDEEKLTPDHTSLKIKKSRHSHQFVKSADITAETSDFDETHPLYGKVCVITGVLNKMTRKEAMQIIANVGGINSDSVTKKVNYLILGNNDYCMTIKNGKSSKQKKAEEYMLKGYDIQIIPENVFYDMLENV